MSFNNGNIKFHTKSKIEYVIIEFLSTEDKLSKIHKGLLTGLNEHSKESILNGTFVGLHTNKNTAYFRALSSISIVSIEVLGEDDMKEIVFFRAHEEDQIGAIDIIKKCLTLLKRKPVSIGQAHSLFSHTVHKKVPKSFYDEVDFTVGEKGSTVIGGHKSAVGTRFGTNRGIKNAGHTYADDDEINYLGLPRSRKVWPKAVAKEIDSDALHTMYTTGPTFAGTTYKKKVSSAATIIKRSSRKPRTDTLAKLKKAVGQINAGENSTDKKNKPQEISKADEKKESECSGHPDASDTTFYIGDAIIDGQIVLDTAMNYPFKHYGVGLLNSLAG